MKHAKSQKRDYGTATDVRVALQMLIKKNDDVNT